MKRKTILSNLKKITFGFALGLLSFSVNSQEQFSKEYGGVIVDDLRTPILKETDGSFVIAGMIAGTGTNRGVQITKTNNQGVVIWSKKYSPPSDFISVTKILKNVSNQYVIIGTMGNLKSIGGAPSLGYGVFLFKTDTNGNYIAGSEKTVFPYNSSTGNGGFVVNDARSMIRGNKMVGFTNEYVLAGQTSINFIPTSYIVVLNANFGVVYSSYLDLGNYSKTEITSVIDIPGAGNSTAGYIVASNIEGSPSTLVRLNTNLTKSTTVFESSYTATGITSKMFISDLERTSDGNYVAAGSYFYTSSSYTSAYAASLLKINSNLDLLWHKTYSINTVNTFKDQLCYDVCTTSDGGYALTGNMWSGSAYSDAMFLIRTNSSGASLFGKKYQPSGVQTFGNTVIQANDGGFGIIGENKGNHKLLFVKTNNLGQTCQNVSNIVNNDQTYPMHRNTSDNYISTSVTTPVLSPTNPFTTYLPEVTGCLYIETMCATFNSTITGSSNFCSSSNLNLTGGVDVTSSGFYNIISYKWDILESDGVGTIIPGGYTSLGSTITGSPGSYTIVGSTLPCDKYYVVRLTTNSQNCGFDSSDKIIHVDCQPSINAGADFTICNGEAVVLNFTSTTWPVSLFQSGIAFSIASLTSSPYHIISVPTSTTTYTLTSGANGTCLGASDAVIMNVVNANPAFIFNYSSDVTAFVSGTANYSNPYNSWTLYKLDEITGTPIQVGSTYTNVANVSYGPLPITFSSGATITYQLCHTAAAGDLNTKYSCPQTICHQSGNKSHTTTESHQSSIDNDLNETISISPNPTNGKINIDLNDVSAEKVVIYNMLGKIVSETIVTDNKKTIDIDLTDLPASIYMIHVHTDGEVILKKVIKN